MLSAKKFYVDMTSSVHLGVVRANRKVVQRGMLEATPNSLIFTDDVSQMKQLWSLKSLRNFQASSDKVFVIEIADPSSDTRVFSFSTPEAKQLQDVVLHHLHVLINSEQPHQLGGTYSAVSCFSVSQTIPIYADETGPVHWKLNTRLSRESSTSSSTVSPTRSRTPSTPRDVFEVDRILEDSSKKEHGTLEAFENEIVFVECGGGGKRIAWSFKCLRRFGHEGDIFTLEVGRKAPGGEGHHRFRTPRAAELNTYVKNCSVVSIGRNTPPSPVTTEKIGKVHAQQFSFASPTHRALPPPPPPPLQPPLPLPPSQALLLLPPTKHGPLPRPPSQPHPVLPTQSLPIQKHRYSHHSMNPKQKRDVENEGHKLSSSSPAFSQQDSLVRRAHSSYDFRPNIFEVRNISDDKREVGHGTVEVTSTDLIYIDSRTQEKWKWPVRFLRKYGYEENIFSFEAGRRCPGGQGLYAFLSERANEIHETILASVHDQSHQGIKVSMTPEHARGVSSNHSRSSLVDDQTVPQVAKLTNKNYCNDNNLSALIKTGQAHQQSPTSDLTTSHTVQTTTPYSVENSVTPLNSFKVGVDPSMPGKVSPNATITPSLQHVKSYGQSQNHYYDSVSRFGQESNTSGYNQPMVNGNGIMNKKSVSPNLSSEQSRSPVSQGKKHNSKSDDNRISERNPKVSDDAGISGDVGTRDVVQKSRSKVLSRLIGKKSKKKVRRTDNIIDSLGQEGGTAGGDMLYVNLQNGLIARSASCDDLLSSCNASSDSHSINSTSSVPLPQPLQNQTPPTNRRQQYENCRFREHSSVSVAPSSAPSSAVLYQNLSDMGSLVDRSHSDPVQAPPTLSDMPPTHNNDNSHLYSNISSLAIQDDGNQPSRNSTAYAEVEIRPRNSPPPINSPHTSPRSSPHPHSPHLNTNGMITSTPKKNPPFTRPKPFSKVKQAVDRRHSSNPAAADPAGKGQSHNRSQSESNYITSRCKVDRGPMGVASVINTNDQVVYAPLDFAAIDAVAQIKRDHADIRHFDEILKRHDVREMEMDRKKRRNIPT